MAQKFVVEEVCPVVGNTVREALEWCDYAVPNSGVVPIFQGGRSYSYRGPYQQMAFTRLVADPMPDRRNLNFMNAGRMTQAQCQASCDAGLTKDHSGYASRHGDWSKATSSDNGSQQQYTKCYGFTHSGGASGISYPHSSGKWTMTAGTCRGMAWCYASRGKAQCWSSKCKCLPGHYTIDGENCIELPDFSKSRNRPSNSGKTNTRTTGTCRYGNCYTRRGAVTCSDGAGGSARRRRRVTNGGYDECVNVPYPCGCSCGWGGCSCSTCYDRNCVHFDPQTPGPGYCDCAPGSYSRDGACVEQPQTQYDREERSMKLPSFSKPSSSTYGECTLYGESTNVPYYGDSARDGGFARRHLWVAQDCEKCEKF
jgi:hypothetical protein